MRWLPSLYNYTLAVKGPGMNEACSIRFGMERETALKIQPLPCSHQLPLDNGHIDGEETGFD